jgi:hypothetical protein
MRYEVSIRLEAEELESSGEAVAAAAMHSDQLVLLANLAAAYQHRESDGSGLSARPAFEGLCHYYLGSVLSFRH